jgi:outer membrane autotransporter protein
MRTPLLLAAVLAALVPAASRAALPPLEVGARLGWASAFGDAAKDTSMKDFTITSQLPLQLELSARLRPALAAGVYASYGFGSAKDTAMFGFCGVAGVKCSGHAVRAGVQGRWSFTSVQPLVPWVGAGLGWEWATVEGKEPSGTSHLSANGLDLSLQGGGDYRVTPRLALGPYVQLAIGRYGSGDAQVSGATSSGGIANKAFHGWFGLGVAGRFDL